MTREEVTKLIEEKLLGQTFDVNLNAKVIANELDKRYPNLKLHSDYNAKDQVGYVIYKGERLVGFRLKKKRGEYRGSLWGYRWTISNVEVFNWFETIEDRLIEIEKRIANYQDQKNKELETKVANFKKVRAVFPDLDWWNFKKVLEGIVEVSYEEIKKEEK